MVRIRLRRVGKRRQPSYRVVVADQRSPRDGRFIEVLGRYNPRTDPSEIEIDPEKALSWLRRGAQPSSQVKALLKRIGVWSEFVKDKGPAPRRPKKHKKTPPPPAAPPAEQTPPADEAPAQAETPPDAADADATEAADTEATQAATGAEE